MKNSMMTICLVVAVLFGGLFVGGCQQEKTVSDVQEWGHTPQVLDESRQEFEKMASSVLVVFPADSAKFRLVQFAKDNKVDIDGETVKVDYLRCKATPNNGRIIELRFRAGIVSVDIVDITYGKNVNNHHDSKIYVVRNGNSVTYPVIDYYNLAESYQLATEVMKKCLDDFHETAEFKKIQEKLARQ